MTLPDDIRSIQRGTLSAAALADVVAALETKPFADGAVWKAVRRLASLADGRPTSDLLVHDGDLIVDELRTGAKPFIGLLLVRGNLIVNGLYRDSMDPESAVVVTGDLRAERLISRGALQVRGDVIVDHEALWIDNDGAGEIGGRLKASFVYTKFHTVTVGGDVEAELVLGSHRRHLAAGGRCDLVVEGDDEHKAALRRVLPEDAVSLEGDPDDDDDWCIDDVDADVLVSLVNAGQRVLRGPWSDGAGED